MTKVLNLLNINAEDPTSLAAVKNVGARIACLSCPSAMIMTPLSVVRESFILYTIDFDLVRVTDRTFTSAR